jgi:hypothetical protein
MKYTLPHASAVPKPLRLFFLVMFAFDAIALVCELVAKFILHLGWPYRSPLLNDSPTPDLSFILHLFPDLHTPAFFSFSHSVPFMYPAALAPLFGLLMPLADRPHRFQALLLLLSLLIAAAFAFRLANTRLGPLKSGLVAAATILLSYPLLFELRQGNAEFFIFLLVGGAVWCFLHEHWHTAAALIGIAGAMKLFPFVYLGLFLARRRYSVLITSVLTAVVVTLASLRYIEPSIAFAWHGINANLAYYQQTVVLSIRRELGFDHSLFGLMKTAMVSGHLVAPGKLHLQPILRVYLVIASLGGIALFFLRIQFLPVINQVICLCVASILLPPVSYDYTLLHLYIPWGMLVLFAVQRRDVFTPGLTAVFLCFAVLMSIQTEFIVHGYVHGGQIKAVVLVALMILALMFPFENATLEGSRVPSPGLGATRLREAQPTHG